MNKIFTIAIVNMKMALSVGLKKVIPFALKYKEQLSTIIVNQKNSGLESSVEIEIYKKLNFSLETLYNNVNNLKNHVEKLHSSGPQNAAETIANDLLPLSESIADNCNTIEEIVPSDLWNLPKYYDMLYLR